MSNYLPNHWKKRNVLARRELDLVRALSRSAPAAVVRKAAERVRAARVRVLRMERSRLYPVGSGYRHRELDQRIREWTATPPDDIVAEFRATLAADAGR